MQIDRGLGSISTWWWEENEKLLGLCIREINLTVSSSLCLMQLFTVEFSTILPCYIITLLGLAFANASKFALGTIPILRQKRDWVGGVKKMAIFADVQYYLC